MTPEELDAIYRLVALERDAEIATARSNFTTAIAKAESGFVEKLGERLIAKMVVEK